MKKLSIAVDLLAAPAALLAADLVAVEGGAETTQGRKKASGRPVGVGTGEDKGPPPSANPNPPPSANPN